MSQAPTHPPASPVKPHRFRLPAGRVLVGACAALLAPTLLAAKDKEIAPRQRTATVDRSSAELAQHGRSEARLIEIYRLIGQGRTRDALARAETLVRDHPNFQLAQLVYGDLLAARARPMRSAGEVPLAVNTPITVTLSELREESLLRIKALRERPPAGLVPSQFLQLSARNRHAIAVDVSKARLYLFENTTTGLKLLADYYISVGKLGAGKASEGDMRTPLGTYYITSNLEREKLKDFYGAGALPINYPNPYDARRGKTGSGIWLHGTPPEQFARAPRASDGCVVLANPDLEHIIRTVQTRTTPVIIAQSLSWVPPQSLITAEVRAFHDALNAWRAARSSGNVQQVVDFYTPDVLLNGQGWQARLDLLRKELSRIRGREIELKDLSYLRWTDTHDTMVVTFGEVPQGARTGPMKRQYWMRLGSGRDSQWKIFFEGVIG